MQTGSRLFRLSVLLAGTSLSLSATLPALAQSAPPGEAADENAGDPPALAGRMSDLSGTVSFHAAGADQWSPASQNYPVTSGNAYWTEPQASATIEIGDDVVVMDGGTELDVTTLDQHQFAASEPQGAIFLGLRDLPDGQALTVTTPRGTVQITQSGQYEIVAGDTNNPTSVTVVSGAAVVTGSGLNLSVGAQQTGAITGTTTFQGGTAAMQQDEFLQAQLAKFQPPAQSAPGTVAQQVRYMTGGQELARYGSWQDTQQYGQLWYPSGVGSDWAPYRDGHWAYVAPWGWNWVDDAPWGFAPFHYGRWVNYGGRWGWMAGAPGVAYGGGYPVYAPALVSFVGVGGDVLAGAAIGFGAGLLIGGGSGIGWFPLGYREPFVPWYHVSDGYFRGINRYSGVDVRNISVSNYRNITVNRYANARFATVAPVRAFVAGDRMRGLARPLPAAALERAHPILGRLPAIPTAATPGLGRAAAARYHVNLPARGAGNAAAGPQIRTGAFGHERPALREAGRPGNVPPATGALPAAARRGEAPGRSSAPGPAIIRGAGPGARPGGLPALRSASPREAPPGIARPGGVRPGAANPSEARTGLDRSPGSRPDAAGGSFARPAENRPAGDRPGAARPSETRPAATRPTEGRPAEARPAPTPHDAVRPQPVRPQVSRPEGARPQVSRPGAEPRPVSHEPRPAPVRAAPTRPAQARPAPERAAIRPDSRPESHAPSGMSAPHPEAPRPAPRAAPARPAQGPHDEHKK